MTSKKQQKDFDSVQLMRRLRERISRETEGMSYEEERTYIRDRIKRGKIQSAKADSPGGAA